MNPVRPIARLRSFSSDESGQMTLVCALMVFLVVVFTAIGGYTNIAIHRRITVQNAVDSAAEAAALWQARGCNLVQGLNNLHYTVNVVAGIAETAASAACVAALVPITRPVACPLCATAPYVDAGQQALNYSITNLQQWVVEATPYFAFLAANACAGGSGAEPLGAAVPAAVSEWIKVVDSELSYSVGAHFGLEPMTKILQDLGNTPALGAIPVYAAPMDPTSLQLHVGPQQGKSFPWKFPSIVGETADKAGRDACLPVYEPAFQSAVRMGWNSDKWGWNDSYFLGHPGYMTWIAGKNAPEDSMGFSRLVWMSGSRVELDSIQTMYSGSVNGGDLSVPAMLGIASSQVEGTPVVDKGDTDAKGRLINVYLLEQLEGAKLGVLH